MKAYHRYLLSDHWRELRALKLSENPACENCGSKRDIEIHHRVYRTKWKDSKLTDLRTLCHSCHNRTHVVSDHGVTDAQLSKLEHAQKAVPIVPFNQTKPINRRTKIVPNLSSIPKGMSVAHWLVESFSALEKL